MRFISILSVLLLDLVSWPSQTPHKGTNTGGQGWLTAGHSDDPNDAYNCYFRLSQKRKHKMSCYKENVWTSKNTSVKPQDSTNTTLRKLMFALYGLGFSLHFHHPSRVKFTSIECLILWNTKQLVGENGVALSVLTWRDGHTLLSDNMSQLKTGTPTDAGMPVFQTALFTAAKIWKQPMSIGGWRNKMWSIHTIEYYSAIKRSSDSCCNVDEAWEHWAKYNEPGKNEQLLYDSIHVRYLQQADL